MVNCLMQVALENTAENVAMENICLVSYVYNQETVLLKH